MKFKELVDLYAPYQLREFMKANSHIIDGISNYLDCETENSQRITPRIELILSTFHLVSMDPYDLFPNSLKVVFVFQDPYPTPGAACGVATATLNGQVQPTLSNIYKRLVETYKPKAVRKVVVDDPETHQQVEAEQEIEGSMPNLIDGDIRGWCLQGVLMWNTSMTTRERETQSHMDAWSLFSEQMMKWMSDRFPFIVFVLFGKKAQELKKFINASKHHIIETSHPAGRGYNYGFNTCNVFNEINRQLVLNQRPSIKWENYNYIGE